MSKIVKISMTFIWACFLFACQEKYERIVPPLDVSGELTQEVPIEGGTYYLTAVCDGEVTVKSDAAWCIAEFVPGAQSNNIKITVQSNEDKKRGCRVSILAFSQPTFNVQINQAGIQIVVVKPEIVGNWQFTNSDNFGRATTGADLELKGSAFFETEGINGGTAVEVGKGSYFIARHGIPANGDGTKVNRYSILMDFKLPEATRACFLQTDMSNSNDVDIFLRANMYQLGIGSVYADLSANPIQAKTWYRLVITAELGQSLKYYLNGVEVFSNDGSGDAQTDSRLAFDPAGVLLFADEDGEDENIHVAQVTIWDQPLDAAAVAALGAVGSNDYITFKGPLVGKWLFQDPENLGAAEIGNDLILNGSSIYEAAGPSADNHAVSVGAGSHFLVKHGIAASGETASGDPATKANEYSLLFDFKVSQTGRYYTFLQTDLSNKNDGDIFINGDGKIGISGGYYSDAVVKPDTWYRWVVTVRCGEIWKQYLDGALLHTAASDHDGKMNVDDRFALDPAGTLFFADEDGEDNEIFVAGAALWNKVLSEDEVSALGKVGSPIK
jgi:hypothetical protein